MQCWRKKTIANVVIGMALTLATFFLLEGLSRALHTVREDLSAFQPEWYTYSAEFGWEKRPHFKGYVAGELQRGDSSKYLREFDSHGFLSIDTAQIRKTDQQRILAIGDSNTFGWGVPTGDSFAEVLDDLLPHAAVINMGVSGYTSFQGHEILVKHFETLHPDLVIASFNFNDRRAIPSEESIDSREKFAREALLHQADLVRGNLYLYRTLQYAMSFLGIVDGSPGQRTSIDVRSASARVPPAQYRENLEKIARLCEEHHVPLVFVVLQDNPAHTQHLRDGISHLIGGRYEAAEQEFRIAVNLDNWFSDLARKYLADLLEQRGAGEEARAIAAITLPGWTHTHGGRPLYLDSEYNDIMRAVGREYGATVIEAGTLLSRDASLYLDLCHPDERGHRMIAMLIKQTLDTFETPYMAAARP
jgi:lysophospholipase L1-like esterase